MVIHSPIRVHSTSIRMVIHSSRKASAVATECITAPNSRKQRTCLQPHLLILLEVYGSATTHLDCDACKAHPHLLILLQVQQHIWIVMHVRLIHISSYSCKRKPVQQRLVTVMPTRLDQMQQVAKT